MKITVNYYVLNLQEGDMVNVEQTPCEDCGHHTIIDVERGRKRVAHFGDGVSTSRWDKEVFSDVAQPRV